MNGGAITLTFDDGYASTLEQAFPALQRHGWPATVFVVTDWLDQGRPYQQRPTLTVDQCRQLNAAGWEIGSHTCSHANLRHLDRARLVHQLADSRSALLQHGFDAGSLAYPGSSFDRRVHDEAAGHYRYLRLARQGRGRLLPSVNAHGIVGNLVTSPSLAEDDWSAMLASLAEARQWGVLALHDLAHAQTPYPWSITCDAFEELVEKIAACDLEVVTMARGAEIYCGGTTPRFPADMATAEGALRSGVIRTLYRLRLVGPLKRFFHETRLGARLEAAFWRALSRLR